MRNFRLDRGELPSRKEFFKGLVIFPFIFLNGIAFAFFGFIVFNIVGAIIGFIFGIWIIASAERTRAWIYGKIESKCPFCGAEISFIKNVRGGKCESCLNRFVIRNGIAYTPEQAKSLNV